VEIIVLVVLGPYVKPSETYPIAVWPESSDAIYWGFIALLPPMVVGRTVVGLLSDTTKSGTYPFF
jgi:hypothetical protein